ncbi:hypothetical protein M5K25_027885 [Dendrobium thyrsiflorum]|uniref:Pentatricopeptide repeat-containing protein n=1 Tax=Dendrobium thyrsiflorum TaxID=117978 RepID=A0ABD0TV01_DENTH
MEHASSLAIIDRAFEMLQNDIAIAFGGAEDVTLIEYACLTTWPFQGLDTSRNTMIYTSASNSIMSFYLKLGMKDCARNLFDEMVWKDSVSWNALIHACWKLIALTQGQCFHGFIVKSGFTADISIYNSLAGDAVNALQLFGNMSMVNDIEIDGFALVCVLQACSFVG